MDGKCSKMTGPKDTSSNRIINKKACYIIFEKGQEGQLPASGARFENQEVC